MRSGLMLVSILFAAQALAHPQHPWPPPLSHLLSEPDHLALLLLPVIAAILMVRRIVRRTPQRPMDRGRRLR